MQVQGIKNINFTSGKLTPEILEAHASALESNDQNFAIKPEHVVDLLDGKLKKSESGRKIVNTLVSGASFAAAALSFKKVAPKLRHGIASATGKIANNFGLFGKKIKIEGINQIAGEMTKDAEKIAQNGDGTILKNVVTKLLGEKKGIKVLNGFKKVGIETGGDVADTAIALGAAILAGREAGDIADETQKERTLKDAFGSITKVVNALPGSEIISGL